MSVKLVHQTLKNDHFSFNAIAFLPSYDSEAPTIKTDWAVFTHGYTANKNDIVSWGQRLSEAGVPTIVFDLPGHYLGSINEVESFDDFKEHAHKCFIDAFDFLQAQLPAEECSRLILGGHSLGAMLSVRALNLAAFEDYAPLAIGVGFGISQHKETHLFETSFYEKTLNVRRQLVCPALDSDVVFPWINEMKHDLGVSGKRIHLICGINDIVVGQGGAQALKESLEAQGNTVTLQEPAKLAHHEPSLASSQVYHFLKKEIF